MLDLFFRKYSWTANLVLLFAAAWIAAETVNIVVGVALRPKPQAEVSAAAGPPPRPPPPASLDVEALYRLIGQEAPRAAEAIVPDAAPRPPQNCDDPAARPARSELRLALVAGVVAERARFSLATIADAGTHETHVVGVGDEVGGARLLAVERLRDDGDATGNGFRVVAILCNGGTKEYLELDPAAGAVAGRSLDVAPVPPPRPGAAPTPGGLEGVRQVADNRYEIERNVIDTTLGNLNQIATKARIVPSFKNGSANGFKLFSIQPGSLYSAIGVQNGDIIQRVNGYEINSPEKALELYQKLKESSHVTIELERGGQVIRKEYNITGP